MKTTLLSALALAIGLSAALTAPTFAGSTTGIDLPTHADGATIDKRRKPRVKGGSGCDDPGDLLEHPACR